MHGPGDAGKKFYSSNSISKGHELYCIIGVQSLAYLEYTFIPKQDMAHNINLKKQWCTLKALLQKAYQRVHSMPFILV